MGEQQRTAYIIWLDMLDLDTGFNLTPCMQYQNKEAFNEQKRTAQMKEQARHLEFKRALLLGGHLWHIRAPVLLWLLCGWAENSDSAASSFVQHWEQRQLNTQMFFSHAETWSNICLPEPYLSHRLLIRNLHSQNTHTDSRKENMRRDTQQTEDSTPGWEEN